MCGCSDRPPTYVVHGMVVFPDGKPLTKGTVEFETEYDGQVITASSDIANDGTFQLGTFEVNDGAVAGEYRVAVIADYDIGTGVERPGKLPKAALHPKYRDFNTSKLEFAVKPQMNNILIEVDYAPEEPESAQEAPTEIGTPVDGS